MTTPYLIPMDRFDDDTYLEARVASAPEPDRSALRTCLRFLYESEGPINLPRDRLKLAERYLDPAELVLTRWLFTRTNGSERKNYGEAALRAARKQRYRCEHCGHGDIRVLNLDHVEGKTNREKFACLCANCHMLKSRDRDWSGAARTHENPEGD